MKRFSNSQNNFYFLKSYKKVLFFLFLLFVLVVIVLGVLFYFLQPRVDFLLDSQSYAPAVEIVANKDLNIDFKFNDVPGNRTFSDDVINLINGAKESIEIAMFALTNQELIGALEAAVSRNVEIKLVLDRSNYVRHSIVLENFYNRNQILDLGIGSDGGDEERYMHNKFMIVDRNTDNETLLAGTFNWTSFQELYDPSYIYSTADQYWIDVFGDEFDRLWSSFSGTDKLVEGNYQPWSASIGYTNGMVEFWWGPGFKENSFKQRMLDLIEIAEDELQIAIWHMTDRGVAQAIFAKAVEGVQVSIITDDYNIWLEDSEFIYLLAQIKKLNLNNIEIVSDVWRSYDLAGDYKGVERVFFNPYLHRHTLIIDNKILIIGSANWSYRGFFQNDESGIVMYNRDVIELFKKSWDYHYDDLRKQKLEILKIDDGFYIGNFSDNYISKNIIVLQEISGQTKEPIICADFININIDTVVNISDNCVGRPVNVFIYDNEEVLGNGWYF